MLTAEQRATMSAMWLARWHSWQGSGISMAEYARREGFDADGAYRWQRVLRRTGQWVEADGAPAVSTTVAVKKRRPAPRFARVTVSDTPSALMVLRIVLMNGRRAELEIGDAAQLGEVIGVLERAA
ncbi:MAG: IS66 family insertion sequence element accessory protein TnpA [Solirubrobacteraceae bacterium]